MWILFSQASAKLNEVIRVCLFKERPLDSPSSLYAKAENIFVDSYFGRPICQTLPPSIKRDKNITTLIAILFRDCGPLTIARSVISVIVDALKPHAFWFFVHV